SACFGDCEGKLCYVVTKGRDQACESCAAAQSFDCGQESQAEEQGVTREGHEISYRVHTLPMCGPDGTADFVLLMCLDTTRTHELEDALRQAERLATVGLTTAGLAHSIKSILAGLEGGLYVVDSGFEHQNQDRLRDGWGMVKGYIEQVSTLVQNLLRYAKAREPRREEVAAAALVSEVVELFESKAALTDITLVGMCEAELPSLSLDRDAIRGCLANLVSNALDACMWDPDHEKEHRIAVAARARAEGGAILEVSDNGPGIAEKNQPKVLAASFTTKGMRGTGLGLLLTRKAIEEHGGTITFSTASGRGTTFRVELPGPHAAGRRGDSTAAESR
ncbi:nitrogen regulation protein NR(II), partial [Planctomycetota bacterium]